MKADLDSVLLKQPTTKDLKHYFQIGKELGKILKSCKPKERMLLINLMNKTPISNK